jgi:alginate biosynthesis protein Alg44
MDIEKKASRDNAAQAFDGQPEVWTALLDTGTEHPKTNIPFAAIIDGRHFSGLSLSLVSAVVSGLSGPDLQGKQRIAVLRFDFDGYTISLQVNVGISRTDAETGQLVLDFIEPTGEHLPTLRHLLNAYIAGDITSLDGIISLRDKAGVANARKQSGQKTLGNYFANALRLTATAVLSIGLAALAIDLVYERIFSKEVQQLAVLAAGGQHLRAVANGQISYLNTKAAKGEVVYTIQAVSGDTLSINMPCDCKILPGAITEGSTVLAGDTVAEAVQQNATPVVLATVSPEQSKLLVGGDVAQLRFQDGSLAYAKLATGSRSLAPAGNGGEVRAVLAPTSPVNQEAIGTPVSIRIINARIFALRQKLGQLFSEVTNN